jgi:hypothetical protein
MRRLENQVKDSYIRDILTCNSDKCGTIGPRFTIQDRGWNLKEMPREQLPDFLNDASGIDSGRRLIDESVEKGLFSDFSDVLSFEDGRYVYKGARYIEPSELFSASYKEAESELALLDFANSKGSEGTLGCFLSTESYAVLPHEAGITSGFSTKPIIGSYGAGHGIIIAIWNVSTKEAVLAHVYALTTFSSVESLFRRISSDESDKLEVHLHGGDSMTRKQAKEMVALVKGQKNSELVSANLCNGYDSKSFAIDSRTGKTSTTFSAKQLEHSSDFEERLKIAALKLSKSSLKLVFDGRRMLQQATVASDPANHPKTQETYCGFKPGFLQGHRF